MIIPYLLLIKRLCLVGIKYPEIDTFVMQLPVTSVTLVEGSHSSAFLKVEILTGFKQERYQYTKIYRVL